MKFAMLICTFVLASQIFAQSENTDRIVMTNSQIKHGKISDRTETYFTLNINNGEMIDTLRRTEVLRIEYANGTMEQVSFGKLNKEVLSWNEKLDLYRNKAAILPFVYTDTYSTGSSLENMSLVVQEQCRKGLEEVNDVLWLQPSDSTNKLLTKYGIDWLNIRKYRPADLCDMLGVTYIFYGSVIIKPKGGATSGSDAYAVENQTTETPDGRREGASISPKHIETIVDLNIYDILGETVFTKAEQSFWESVHAYQINLDNLINDTRFNIKKVKK
jgi:hypothetical protein